MPPKGYKNISIKANLYDKIEAEAGIQGKKTAAKATEILEKHFLLELIQSAISRIDYLEDKISMIEEVLG